MAKWLTKKDEELLQSISSEIILIDPNNPDKDALEGIIKNLQTVFKNLAPKASDYMLFLISLVLDGLKRIHKGEMKLCRESLEAIGRGINLIMQSDLVPRKDLQKDVLEITKVLKALKDAIENDAPYPPNEVKSEEKEEKEVKEVEEEVKEEPEKTEEPQEIVNESEPEEEKKEVEEDNVSNNDTNDEEEAKGEKFITQTEFSFTEEDAELVEEFLSESLDHLSSIEEKILELENSPEDTELINEIFRPFHSMKGASGFLGFETLQEFSHKVENILDQARKGQKKITGKTINLLLQAVDIAKSLLSDISTALQNIKDPDNKKPIEPKDLTEFMYEIEHKAWEGEEVIAQDTGGDSANQSSGDVTKYLSKKKEITTATIKVDLNKMESLSEAVGELVIAFALVNQNEVLANELNYALFKDIQALGKITKNIQDIAMSLRMVPLKQTFQKMNRLVRDLTHKMNKKARLIVIGEETEIDRTLVEEINDPLVHMIRNAIDHGLEDPEERKQLGKPEVGTITLKAYHQGGNVVIEVGDDGRGLDPDKLRKKAVEKGIYTEEEVENMSDEEIYNVIMMPGFSTKEVATDISGRGVGMDVVKQNITKLGGSVSIKTEKGKGTTFYIFLPLTTAIVDGMIVKIGKEKYIIPTVNIRESIKPLPENIQSVKGEKEILYLRGQIYPLVRLGDVFGIYDALSPLEGLVILVEAGNKVIGLVVDDLIGQQQVVIKSLGEKLKGIEGIAGGAILGDGRVGLILDISGIINLYENM